MAKKPTYLRNMKITEVSLVTEPACPDADILFTKGRGADWRALALHAEFAKGFNPKEPRDQSGRWTSGAVAALGHAKDTARQFAQALSDRARAAATATVGNTVSAIKTTRPRGAFPVKGGGVHFEFQHDLKAGGRVHTAVQIRPEHLGQQEYRVMRGANGKYEMKTQPTHWHRALGFLEGFLRRSNVEEKQPFATRHMFGATTFSAEEARNQDAQEEANRLTGAAKRTSLLNAARGGYGGMAGSSTLGSVTGASAPVAPTSTETGGIGRTGPNGIPTYDVSEGPEPSWARDMRNRATRKPTADDNGKPIPLQDANHQTAGGHAYYRNGRFVPQTAIHAQAAIERAHDWLRQNPDKAQDTRTQMQRNPQTSGGRSYFTAHGDFVPGGTQRYQESLQGKYRTERDRKDTEAADARLAAEQEEQRARSGGEAKYSQLFHQGAHADDEYDLGSPAQRSAALAAAREDRMKKSLFALYGMPQRASLFASA